jgi:uncharacterized protein YggE
MKTLVVCAFALFPLTVVAAGSEVAGLAGLPNQPFLYVEGKAEIEKPPDLISLHFEISGRNADQGKANQEVQAKAKKLFGLIKESKIEDRDVVAQDLQSEPEFERDEADEKKRQTDRLCRDTVLQSERSGSHKIRQARRPNHGPW